MASSQRQTSYSETEARLMAMWKAYIHYVDHYGQDETAKEMKQKYLAEFHRFRRQRNWNGSFDQTA